MRSLPQIDRRRSISGSISEIFNGECDAMVEAH